MLAGIAHWLYSRYVLGAGVVYRVVLACLSVGLLCGCMARDPSLTVSTVPSGRWKIERQTDRITGAPTSSALLVTNRSSTANSDFAEPAQLQLLCFKGEPLVRLAFGFRVGSTNNTSFAYRFDEKQGREPEARFLYQANTVVLEERTAVAQFLADLVTSKTLFVRIRSLNVGRSVAEFEVDGARAAVDAALGECMDKNERSKLRANS
jgi:hypothetical protein